MNGEMLSLRLWSRAAVAGLITSVLLAWACALWSPASNYELPPLDPTWQGEAYGWSFGYWVHETLNAKGTESGPTSWNALACGEYAAGWPYYAVWSHVAAVHDADGEPLSGWDLPASEMIRRGVSTGRLPGLPQSWKGRRLPVDVAWAGLAADTAFWTIPWALVLRVGMGALRVAEVANVRKKRIDL